MRNAQPHAAHQALMLDLQQTMARYSSMPVVERIAVLAQYLGAELAEMPRHHDMADVMRAVSMNIAAGNQGAAMGSMLVAESTDAQG